LLISPANQQEVEYEKQGLFALVLGVEVEYEKQGLFALVLGVEVDED
jgi:hypothetical protein